jgi:hypothetical protein
MEERKGNREREREREMPPVEEKRSVREKKNRREGEKGFPKDLCTNLENCRDLSVKHNFSLI